ncbi:MAG TPA: hypothetical protein VEQ65_14325, partial [Opitutus sp.]|nr:hypothetical protein [Opitutus sp.]
MRIHVFGVLTFTLGWLIAPTSTGHAANGAEPTATVDTTPVLKIGEVTVSRYQLQKYHGRFVEGFRQREGRAPTAAEHTSWIDL